jgi:hypothetical protein
LWIRARPSPLFLSWELLRPVGHMFPRVSEERAVRGSNWVLFTFESQRNSACKVCAKLKVPQPKGHGPSKLRFWQCFESALQVVSWAVPIFGTFRAFGQCNILGKDVSTRKSEPLSRSTCFVGCFSYDGRYGAIYKPRQATHQLLALAFGGQLLEREGTLEALGWSSCRVSARSWVQTSALPIPPKESKS